MGLTARWPRLFECDLDFAKMYPQRVEPIQEAFLRQERASRRVWEDLIVVWRAMRPVWDAGVGTGFRLEEMWTVSHVTNHTASPDASADRFVTADEVFMSATNGLAIVKNAFSKEEALLRYAASGRNGSDGVWSIEGDRIVEDMWSGISPSYWANGHSARRYRLVKESA